MRILCPWPFMCWNGSCLWHGKLCSFTKVSPNFQISISEVSYPCSGIAFIFKKIAHIFHQEYLSSLSIVNFKLSFSNIFSKWKFHMWVYCSCLISGELFYFILDMRILKEMDMCVIYNVDLFSMFLLSGW